MASLSLLLALSLGSPALAVDLDDVTIPPEVIGEITSVINKIDTSDPCPAFHRLTEITREQSPPDSCPRGLAYHEQLMEMMYASTRTCEDLNREMDHLISGEAACEADGNLSPSQEQRVRDLRKAAQYPFEKLEDQKAIDLDLLAYDQNYRRGELSRASCLRPVALSFDLRKMMTTQLAKYHSHQQYLLDQACEARSPKKASREYHLPSFPR